MFTPYRESLFYCLETGANWAGTIGEEEVTVRFPHLITKEQITTATPPGYEVEGDQVRWRFKDFEPRGKDDDIALTYLRPDVIQVLSTLRAEVRKHPQSSTSAVKLAKHLVAFGKPKSNSGFPPSRLTQEQYASVLLNILSPADRQTFIGEYPLNAEGLHEEVSKEWTNKRLDLVQILADAGYRDRDSQLPFVVEGERLLKDTLARDPHNAEAWNVYLASYWRFSFAAVGHWFGMTRLSRAQAKLIETAAANCPEDECIQLWLSLRRSPSDKNAAKALSDAITRHGFMQLDIPNLGYGYY